MHGQKQNNVIIFMILITIVYGVSLLFVTREVNYNSSQLIEYRPMYVYNVKVEVIKPPAEPVEEILSDDTYLLAQLIYAEAKNQPYEGMIAVGNVIMNRVASPQYPDTIRDVIYQKNQFTPVNDGSINNEPNDVAIQAAKDVINGKRVVSEDALFYYNPHTSTSQWIFSREVITQIGDHAFAM